MESKICYIVGAGNNYGLDFVPQDGDYVIAADDGFKYLQEKGIVADLVIGDFDSFGKIPTHDNVKQLETEKNFTDMYEAIKCGIKKGYDNFQMYCGTGGRFDHTFANIQTLSFLSQQGKAGYLIDKDCVITTITNSSIIFDTCCKGYVSVFSYSNESTGVNIKGLKYTHLENNELASICPMGVSNEFVGTESTITVTSGTLVVIFPRKYKNNARHLHAPFFTRNEQEKT